jgi:hypothetical protein
VDRLHAEAVELSQEKIIRKLSQMWRTVYTNKIPICLRPTQREKNEFESNSLHPELFSKYKTVICPLPMYVNIVSRKTQWTKPYSDSTFRTQDIDYEIFLEIVLTRDLFKNRYFTSLFFCTFFELFMHLFIHLFIYLSMNYLFINLFTYSWIYLYANLSICSLTE